ncbi:MAG: DUF2254 domain-containing protein [Microcoleaceae cyanobacterium]
MTRLTWFFHFFLRYYRNMGLRVAIYALLALAVALISPLGAAQVANLLPLELTFEAVLPVLTILASSMLAVSTFSLSIMVSSHRAAAAATTPRVHRLLLEDTTTQSVFATFIGAFVYALISIILYRSQFYPEDAALLVMGITITVAALVVISLLRWIDHLKDLGSVDQSLASAQKKAAETLSAYARTGGFGVVRMTESTIVPDQVTILKAPKSGFLQLIDVSRLQDCLPGSSAIYIRARPGQHMLEGWPLAEVSGTVTDEDMSQLAAGFTFGSQRTYEQDAEFGLSVLAETALRALSPGINDPGTATLSIAGLKELLWAYGRTEEDPDTDRGTRVFARFAHADDLMEAAFAAIARDGAGMIEVALATRQGLAELSHSEHEGIANAAVNMAQIAAGYCERAGLSPREAELLQNVHFARPH